MKRTLKTWTRAASVVSLLAALALTVAGGTSLAKEAATPPKLSLADRPVDRTARLPASFSGIVKKVAPCVVNIYSTRKVTVQPFGYQFFDDPMFRRFFGNPFGDGGRPQTHNEHSLGSGVIVSEDGYILTNNHVVEGADEIKVVLADGKTKYEARVIGRDPQTDVAVIKVDAKKLPAMTLADSDQVEVGDFVLAVGNPFGVGQSVSQGIVSAVGRGSGILGEHGFEDFLQTDAPINPGNSGGALVDVEGRLVGINQSIVSRSGGSSGVGFAVPINLARSVMERLVSDGKISRGYLGVSIQSVTPALAKRFKLDTEEGAFVGGVSPETPAAEAGLKEGDVITELDGKKVADSRHLRLMIAQTPPKTKVNLKVIRDGRAKELTATLGRLPEELGGVAEGENTGDKKAASVFEGIELSDLDANLRQQLDIPANVRGVLVTKLDEDSPAADAGLREGDVILEVERSPVRTAEQLRELASKAGKDGVLLRVWSKSGGFGGTRYLVVENAAKK
ncbi:MAG: Do family serine endopeptidase [Verrucomicrobia bacterium]|nr:MAG: Do family serine endopeptidase [Verrucomicrobiota bacterium]